MNFSTGALRSSSSGFCSPNISNDAAAGGCDPRRDTFRRGVGQVVRTHAKIPGAERHVLSSYPDFCAEAIGLRRTYAAARCGGCLFLGAKSWPRWD